MCDLRLHDFAREYPRLREMGLEVIAIFHSSPGRLQSHFSHRPLPFPIIADPSRRLYRSYGVEISWIRLLSSALKPSFYWDWLRSMRHGFFGGVDWQLASMPADFLIGQDGTVLRAHYGRDIGDHMPVEEIEQALSELDAN
jgi:thioredoxin-dependent peroxiredoxin